MGVEYIPDLFQHWPEPTQYVLIRGCEDWDAENNNGPSGDSPEPGLSPTDAYASPSPLALLHDISTFVDSPNPARSRPSGIRGAHADDDDRRSSASPARFGSKSRGKTPPVINLVSDSGDDHEEDVAVEKKRGPRVANDRSYPDRMSSVSSVEVIDEGDAKTQVPNAWIGLYGSRAKSDEYQDGVSIAIKNISCDPH